MYRLLLPGISIKRWMLLNLTGMLLFALGFALVLSPEMHARLRVLVLGETGHAMGAAPLAAAPYLVGILLIMIGLLSTVAGTRKLVRAFTVLANPRMTGRELVQALLAKGGTTQTLRVVGIGGGTGLSTLLRGLKGYPLSLTAIVTVTDDGGSSGRLREDLAMPPPGDLRNCLVALADAEPMMERLFQHRFTERARDLAGHTLGNLIIAGLQELTGDFNHAIQQTSQVLAVRGRVLPSANEALLLRATMADGRQIDGETAIVADKSPITEITIVPPDVQPLPEALEAIRTADVVIVGPGSVYTSIVPNLIIPGVAEALMESPAIKFFVCNVMTQPGESDAFTAARHLEVVLQHLPCDNPFHYAVINVQQPQQDVVATYGEKGQHMVEADLDRVRALGTIPLTSDLLADIHLARHDPHHLARCILEKIATHGNWPRLLKKWH